MNRCSEGGTPEHTTPTPTHNPEAFFALELNWGGKAEVAASDFRFHVV